MFTTTLAAIAMSFGAQMEQPEKLSMGQILINKPERDLHTNNLNFQPINMGEIKKIEDSTVLAMSTTKCCAGGTIDLSHTWSWADQIEACMQPNGPPCP